MSENSFNQDDVNKLINSAWNDDQKSTVLLLREKYERRLKELEVSSNQVEKNLQIEYRTLNGILDGNLKRFDLLSLLKVGHFLEIPDNEMVDLYVRFVAEKHKEDIERSKKRTFILNNFDLPALRSIGVINSIQNFDHIEQQLNQVLGLKSITDYNNEELGAAFSSTKVKPKNDKNRKYFKNKARQIFQLINNSNRYDKQALIDYFGKIRWHSTDIDKGIISVIVSLYELGVTVIFQPKIPGLQMRGATFAVNDKPCIVLTNYRESYPTLWFAFLHELFHVLFDWEDILAKRYHLSEESNDILVVKTREEEANDFAREYLFPEHKLESIKDSINQRYFIKEFAFDNHVHPSIIYANYAFKYDNDETNHWATFEKLIHPSITNLISNLGGNLPHKSSALEFANYYKNEILKIQ